jgi:phosphate-selective porin OprO/OprP
MGIISSLFAALLGRYSSVPRLLFAGALCLRVLCVSSYAIEADPFVPLPATDPFGEMQPASPQIPMFLASQPEPAPEEVVESASLEERLAELESKYSDLEENYEKLAEDYSALDEELGLKVGDGHDEMTMKVNARIHLDYWGFPDTSAGANAFETGDPDISVQDRLGVRRMRFCVRGDVWKTMEYRLDMEFARGFDPEFRDVYLGWHDLPFLHTLLVGNQKRPYGLDHINSSNFNVFLERPFVIDAINPDARRVGVQSWGFSEDLKWNWRYGVFNQRNIQDEGFYVSDHAQGQIAGRLANTWWWDEASNGRGFGHWAIAGTVADPDGSGLPGRATNEARFATRPEARTTSRWIDTGVIVGADNYQVLAFENMWNFGSLQVTGEYQKLWLDRDGNEDLQFGGGYVYFAYFLTGETMCWDRETGQLARISPFENFFVVDTLRDGVRAGWGAWQLAYRWSYADFTDQNILGGIGDSHTVSLNWYWTAYSRFQIEAIRGQIDDHAPVAGFTSGDYTILGTRFSIDF